MDLSEICSWSATDLAEAIRGRRLSSVEVVSAHLERLGVLNPLMNTVIQIAEESASEQARAAEEAVAAGGSPLGLGTDSGGSLRSPAHYCGIATFRPCHRQVDFGGSSRRVAGAFVQKTGGFYD